MRRHRANLRRRPGLVVAAATATATAAAASVWSSVAPFFVTPRLPATLSRQVDHVRGDLRVRSAVAEAPTAVVGDSTSWMLPSVDKDVLDFHSGTGAGYAWVQTSTTMYLFTPAVEDKDGKVKVDLDVTEQGSQIRLAVAGVDILTGPLQHGVKPGNEIWMVEDAPDGRSFVVCELDKDVNGEEWTAVKRPVVTLGPSFNQPVVSRRTVNEEEMNEAVDATLEHLRRQYGGKMPAPADHGAEAGDLMVVDMEGFELMEDGSRGDSLPGVGSAQGMKLELGLPGALPKDVMDQLIGIKVNETRDVRFTMGKRGGALAGQTVLIALACNEIKQQIIPELNDEFAKKVKQAEQFSQAGTEAGIPEEEYGLDKIFTMELLRAEVEAEVQKESGVTVEDNIQAQLEAYLYQASQVDCEWASLNETKAYREEIAAINEAVMDKAGLEPIDMEEIRKLTWEELGKPKDGESHAEVGSNPDREFQEQHSFLLRQHRKDRVMAFLEERMEVAQPGASPS